VRRLIAGGAAVVVLILLILGVRGCLNARKERAFKDYARDVGALVGESNQLSDQLFGLLSDPGDAGEVDIENAFNQFRNQSAQLVERLRGTDTPDELSQPQRFLIETFEFRRDGVAAIANALPTALAPQDRRESTTGIAAEMQQFLASDVIYRLRVKPNIDVALEEEGLQGEARIPDSPFLPDIDWLDPTTVADRISRISTGGGAGGPVAPGLHGNGLGTVTLGGQALTPGAQASITLSDDLAFEVQAQNQGENTETDVVVRVTVGSGGDAIELEETLPEIAAGETQTVTLPLAERPPTGEQIPITVEVEPVPGEEKTDNNVGEFSAIFTG
jgi:hypothetical protein